MWRATIASLMVAGVAALGCATDEDPVAANATDEPGADEPGVDEPGVAEPGADEPGADVSGADDANDARLDELEAELAQVRERVDQLEERTDALEAGHADATSNADGSADTEAARPRTAEGLIDQLRTHVRDVDDLPDGFEPGTTDWSSFEVPAAVDGVYDTPGEIVAELAAIEDAPRLGTEVWETTVRVVFDEHDPDLAYGAMLSWGFLDDSIEGHDVRITLTRTDDDRWEPGGAEQRFHCMRGVTEDGELCV